MEGVTTQSPPLFVALDRGFYEVVPSPEQRSVAEWSEDSDADDDGSDDDDGFALHLQDALDGIRSVFSTE